jgi:hypothetical protein
MIKIVNATRRPMNVGIIDEIQSKINPATALGFVTNNDDGEKNMAIRTIPSINSKNAIMARKAGKPL